MSERPNSDTCLHPARGGQEHILSSGTGDYLCRACAEPMPIITTPDRCMSCTAKLAHFAPESTHGLAWECLDCGNVWGWVAR